MVRKKTIEIPSTRFICDDFTHPSYENLSPVNLADIYPTSKRKESRIDRQIQHLFEEIESGLINLRELVVRRSEYASSLCWFSFFRKTEKRMDSLFDATYKAEVAFQQKLLENRVSSNNSDEL